MISIVLPTYNEKENIAELIHRLQKAVPDSEIVVIDDSSPDGTAGAARKAGKNVRVIERKERGLPSAIARGIAESKGGIVGWMDCDLCMPPEMVPKLAQALDDADIAIGSRFVKGGRDARSFGRVLTSRLMNGFAHIVLGQVRDYDSGFVLARRKVFDKVGIDQAGYGEYCIAFLYNAKKQGFKIVELPYTFTDRERGESKTTERRLSMLRHGLMYSARVIKLRLGLK